MSHYDALRSRFPRLPETPTTELKDYAAAMDAFRDAAIDHEDRLSVITAAYEDSVSKIPSDADNKDVQMEAALGAARKATEDENARYTSVHASLDARRGELYARLEPSDKAAMSESETLPERDDGAAAKIERYISTLDDVTKELITDLNSQSASTSIDIAVGYITKERYLCIPAHLSEKIFDLWDSQRSSDTYANGLTAQEMIAVAAVNLPAFASVQGSEFLALVRAQVCALIGAPRDARQTRVRFHEVKVVNADTTPETLKRITDWMKSNIHVVKALRYFAINFVCLTNHVILSLRSHWKNDTQFNTMWNNGFKGALLDQVLSQVSYDRAALLHDCIHPWGLWILFESHKNFAAKDICDNSMKIRFRGSACGTAAYTGAAALIDQMRATKLFDNFFRVRANEISQVQVVADQIKSNRAKYSLNHRYYGYLDAAPLPTAAVQAVAPVLMAYRDVFLKNTTFKDIRAIAKIAENADGVRKVLVEKMKTLVKDAATKIEDLV